MDWSDPTSWVSGVVPTSPLSVIGVPIHTTLEARGLHNIFFGGAVLGSRTSTESVGAKLLLDVPESIVLFDACFSVGVQAKLTLKAPRIVNVGGPLRLSTGPHTTEYSSILCDEMIGEPMIVDMDLFMSGDIQPHTIDILSGTVTSGGALTLNPASGNATNAGTLRDANASTGKLIIRGNLAQAPSGLIESRRAGVEIQGRVEGGTLLGATLSPILISGTLADTVVEGHAEFQGTLEGNIVNNGTIIAPESSSVRFTNSPQSQSLLSGTGVTILSGTIYVAAGSRSIRVAPEHTLVIGPTAFIDVTTINDGVVSLSTGFPVMDEVVNRGLFIVEPQSNAATANFTQDPEGLIWLAAYPGGTGGASLIPRTLEGGTVDGDPGSRLFISGSIHDAVISTPIHISRDNFIGSSYSTPGFFGTNTLNAGTVPLDEFGSDLEIFGTLTNNGPMVAHHLALGGALVNHGTVLLRSIEDKQALHVTGAGALTGSGTYSFGAVDLKRSQYGPVNIEHPDNITWPDLIENLDYASSNPLHFTGLESLTIGEITADGSELVFDSSVAQADIARVRNAGLKVRNGSELNAGLISVENGVFEIADDSTIGGINNTLWLEFIDATVEGSFVGVSQNLRLGGTVNFNGDFHIKASPDQAQRLFRIAENTDLVGTGSIELGDPDDPDRFNLVADTTPARLFIGEDFSLRGSVYSFVPIVNAGVLDLSHGEVRSVIENSLTLLPSSRLEVRFRAGVRRLNVTELAELDGVLIAHVDPVFANKLTGKEYKVIDFPGGYTGTFSSIRFVDPPEGRWIEPDYRPDALYAIIRCVADLDSDGFTDSNDISLFVDLFITGDLDADLDQDGFLTVGDISLFVELFLAGC